MGERLDISQLRDRARYIKNNFPDLVGVCVYGDLALMENDQEPNHKPPIIDIAVVIEQDRWECETMEPQIRSLLETRYGDAVQDSEEAGLIDPSKDYTFVCMPHAYLQDDVTTLARFINACNVDLLGE